MIILFLLILILFLVLFNNNCIDTFNIGGRVNDHYLYCDGIGEHTNIFNKDEKEIRWSNTDNKSVCDLKTKRYGNPDNIGLINKYNEIGCYLFDSSTRKKNDTDYKFRKTYNCKLDKCAGKDIGPYNLVFNDTRDNYSVKYVKEDGETLGDLSEICPCNDLSKSECYKNNDCTYDSKNEKYYCNCSNNYGENCDKNKNFIKDDKTIDVYHDEFYNKLIDKYGETNKINISSNLTLNDECYTDITNKCIKYNIDTENIEIVDEITNENNCKNNNEYTKHTDFYGWISNKKKWKCTSTDISNLYSDPNKFKITDNSHKNEGNMFINKCEYTSDYNNDDKLFDTEEECKNNCEKLKKWFDSCDDNELYFPGNCSGQSKCFNDIFDCSGDNCELDMENSCLDEKVTNCKSAIIKDQIMRDNYMDNMNYFCKDKLIELSDCNLGEGCTQSIIDLNKCITNKKPLSCIKIINNIKNCFKNNPFYKNCSDVMSEYIKNQTDDNKLNIHKCITDNKPICKDKLENLLKCNAKERNDSEYIKTNYNQLLDNCDSRENNEYVKNTNTCPITEVEIKNDPDYFVYDFELSKKCCNTDNILDDNLNMKCKIDLYSVNNVPLCCTNITKELKSITPIYIEE